MLKLKDTALRATKDGTASTCDQEIVNTHPRIHPCRRRPLQASPSAALANGVSTEQASNANDGSEQPGLKPQGGVSHVPLGTGVGGGSSDFSVHQLAPTHHQPSHARIRIDRQPCPQYQ